MTAFMTALAKIRRAGRCHGPLLSGFALLMILTGSGPAGAKSAEPAPSGWHLQTGIGTGALAPDPSLADYRWDTKPAALLSLRALARSARFATGLRYSRWGSVQATGLTGATTDPAVSLDNLDFLLQARALTLRGWQLWGTAAVGRAAIGYSPDTLVVATVAPAPEIKVDYAPLTSLRTVWGLELRRDLGHRLGIALSSEWSSFTLDASHRRGADIVTATETFINWSLSLQVSWSVRLA